MSFNLWPVEFFSAQQLNSNAKICVICSNKQAQNYQVHMQSTQQKKTRGVRLQRRFHSTEYLQSFEQQYMIIRTNFGLV